MKRISSNFAIIFYSVNFQKILPTIYQYYAFIPFRGKYNKLPLMLS